MVLLLLAAPWFTSAGEPDRQAPVERLVQQLESLKPSSVGTDRQGNLWAWSRDGGRVLLFDGDGREWKGWELADAAAVDVDAEWGLVALNGVGTHLLRPGVEGAEPLELHGQAKNLALRSRCRTGRDGLDRRVLCRAGHRPVAPRAS